MHLTWKEGWVSASQSDQTGGKSEGPHLQEQQRQQHVRLGEYLAATYRQHQNGSSGNTHRNYEPYLALTREATQNGDIIEAENWYQRAEHHVRVIREGDELTRRRRKLSLAGHL